MSGEFGSFALEAGVDTVICENTSAGKILTLSINILNRTGNGVPVTLAMSTTTTPVDGEYLEDLTIPGHTPLERGGIILAYGQKIIATAESEGINATTWGIISYE